MPTTPRRTQLQLEWSDAVQWHEVPVAARAELRELLRELLRQAVRADHRAEGADGE